VNNFWYGPDGLPAIASNLTIQGNGATIERIGSTPFRLFYVSGEGIKGTRLFLNSRDSIRERFVNISTKEDAS